MLHLLNPVYAFLGLGLAGLVVFVHFYQRRQSRSQFFFSHVRLLSEIAQERLPRKRIKDIVLAALRAGGILFLLMALARPLVRGVFGADANSARQRNIFWFVFDVSYSMGYKDASGATLLARSRQAADLVAEAVRSSIPNAEFGVLPFSDHAREELMLLPLTDLQAFRQALARLNITAQATSHFSWVEKIAAGQDASRLGGIFVFTDLARHGFAPGQAKSNQLAPILESEGIPVIFVNAGAGSRQNRRLVVRHEEGALAAQVEVKCFGGGQDKPSVSLSVADGQTGTILSSSRIKNCAQSDLPLAQFIPTDRLDRPLQFLIEEDRLAADDAQSLVFHPRSEGSLLVVDGQPGRRASESESFYVREALRSMRTRVNWTSLTQEEMERAVGEPAALARVDQIWLLNPHTMTPPLLDFLRSFVRDRRHKLVVSLGVQADRQGIENILGVTLGEPRQGGQGNLLIGPAGGISGPSLEAMSAPARRAGTFGAPEARGAGARGQENNGESSLKWLGNLNVEMVRQFELGPIRLDKFFLIEDATRIRRNLLSFEITRGQSIPLLVELESFEGKAFLLTTTMDLEWTNLPLKGFFLTMVRGLIEEASRPSPVRNVIVGGYWAGQSGSVTPQSVVTSLSGKRLPVSQGKIGLQLGPLDELGFYKVTGGSIALPESEAEFLVRLIATHLPPETQESDLTMAGSRDIRSLLGSKAQWAILPIADILKKPKKSIALLGSKELGRPLLMSALLMLGMESLVGLWQAKK